MKHDERTLLAFLAGDLDEGAAEAFDRHLVDCADCWAAVQQDRAGRLAAERLRSLAPPALRDRVRLAIECTGQRSRRRRRGWRAGAAIVAAVVVALLAFVMLVRPRSQPSDGGLAAIVTAAQRTVAHSPVGRARAAGVMLNVETRRAPHGAVLVTTAQRPFPMPADAIGMRNKPDEPWYSATQGWNVMCYSTPRPTLLIGRVPLPELQQLGAQLQHS
jgi:hypothetical protein